MGTLTLATDILTTLRDERDILTLLARFDDAAIRNDLNTFGQLWTQDAVWEIGEPVPMTARGREAIVDFLRGSKGFNEFFFRMTARPVFLPQPGFMGLRSTTIELAGRTGGKAYANVALYEDEVVKVADTWLFQRRSYRYLWVDTDAELHGQIVAQIPSALAEVR